MPGVDVPRARRWFWALVVAAVAASGGLYEAVVAPSGPLAAVLLLVSGLVATTAVVQAVRVLRAVNGPLELSLDRPPRSVTAAPGRAGPARRRTTGLAAPAARPAGAASKARRR